MLLRRISGVILIYALLLPVFALGQAPAKVYEAPREEIDRIIEEGTKRSQVMQTLGYMTDVIGPRLTNSPGMKRANEWTRDQLAKYGLENAKLEPWGPFGRGWTLKRFYAMVDGPTAFPLIAHPKAWSPGTDTLLAPPPPVDPKAKKPKTPPPAPGKVDTAYTAEVIHLNITTVEELDQFKGKLKGKIVLVGTTREVPAHFTPEGTRETDTELMNLANAPNPSAPRATPTPNPAATPNPQFAAFQALQRLNNARMRFLADEGAAIIVDAGRGDGGTIFVQQAQAVQPPPPAAGTPPSPPARLYDKETKIPIQISTAVEHFNRMARMIAAGEKVTMTVDLAVEYQDQDMMGYNTIAEIPGSDPTLKEEIVMLGGHLDSWQSGTGATDNAAGCAVMMEAVRIIKALGLKPRRTIRIALWSGEEQGLIGSREYVKDHFGYFGETRPPVFGGGGGPGGGGGQGGPAAAPRVLTKGAEYDKFSAYFNIDNGTGKIRGVHMQGNEGVRSIFRQWLAPFKSMGADTLTLANTGGTDHLSFDAIGLPGFQFIQDEIEYSSRTHHSNMDVFDRIQADDMKQMSVILAAFVYQTAMMDEKMPRKAPPR